MERVLIIIFLLLGLNSCKKGTGKFIFTGTVTDVTFSTGHEGASLSLYKVPIGTSDEILVQTITLPSTGTYKFEVPRERMERYVLKAAKNLYFPIEKEVYYSELSINNDNIINLQTKAMAWAKIHFKNNNPNALDHFRYIKQEGLADCLSCCPITAQDFYGALDTTFYCLNNANTSYSIFYWELNTPNSGLKTTFTTAFDTTLIEVIY
jgi:hypothetical protein